MAKTAKQLTLACEHLRSGNLIRARALYQRVIRQDPGHADAWHLLGVALAQAGETDGAAKSIVKAIQLGGPVPDYCANLGRVLARIGRHAEAAACFGQAIVGDPLNSRISYERGESLASSGQSPAAVCAFRRAAELDPANPAPHFQLGNVLFQMGDFRLAALHYEEVLARRENHAESHYNLGVIRMIEGHTVEAGACFRKAIELRPGYAEAHNNLAMLEHNAGNYDAAALEYQLALKSGQDFDTAAYNQARLLQDRDELDQCCDAYRSLLARSPDFAEARLNLGNALLALGDPQKAAAEYRHAVSLLPDSADAHFNLGLALLQSGSWSEGWQHHEWRLRQPGTMQRKLTRPRWDGSPIAGKRILIHAEQGMGDTLQFSRFAAVVSNLGGRVLLECQGPLTRLLSSLDQVEGVMPAGGRIPEYDCHAPLMSLPAILGTTLADLEGDNPYLLADRELVERWSESLSQSIDPSLFRVGLTWAGNPGHKNDRKRSMPSNELDVLAGVPGVAFFNLQHNITSRLSPALSLLPMVEHCRDFADTAAAVLNLDLIITVDTSVAHLAGALGKPVWMLLPNVSDWRWMTGREDTPWYPSMRLFRQTHPGDWQSVLQGVRAELMKIV